MSHVGPRGRTCSRTLRSVALLTTGVLALPVLSACTSGKDDEGPKGTATPDVAPAARKWVEQGGTVHWAVDSVPATLNAFQADADATTGRVAEAVLPSLFTLDRRGRPQANPDYLESAKIVEREPKQVVLYKLNQKAVWSDGREIGAPDFVAQWRALRGKDSAYWTARNAGYERIEKIERGANNLEVRVTFNKPYADWKSLFSPLYPKDVTGTPNAFNDGARKALKISAGPFQVKTVDRKAKETALVRNPRWWGEPAKLDSIVLRAVARGKRAAALAEGKVDIADIDSGAAKRIALAHKDKGSGGSRPLTHGPGAEITPASALRSWAEANGSDDEKAEEAQEVRARKAEAVEKYAGEQKGLARFAVRKSLEPASTQLALNGESGPLADERVRRAVARALDRQELADTVLGPLGLPSKPPGSHLALLGQQAYADSSRALGKQDTQEAQALLADAGWTPGGGEKKKAGDGTKAGSAGEGTKAGEKKGESAAETADGKKDEKSQDKSGASASGSGSASGPDSGSRPASAALSDAASDEGTYIVGDDKPRQAGPRPESATHVISPARTAAVQGMALLYQAARADDSESRGQTVNAAQDSHDKKPGGMAGAYAPRGTAAPASGAPNAVAQGGPLGKDGKPLTLRFVLPAGEGGESLRAVGERISRMLQRIGIRTDVTKVADDSYFKDHIASGDYDLALYSWPATAYPATDGRPIYAKPVPASDGSLLVEQNYTRVGTNHIDQLFEHAASELDEGKARDLVRQADARIWAAAGSIPLYQRPQLVATRPALRNAGAFGFETPRYQDIGYRKAGASGPDLREPEKK
ncbi:ABC transporter family substrate-binding protein [Streptomyces corynorhini]|uniref:ABC transporter family substrate-binding protein n=1 Tax=Streptomyces corynorhini TaxID=2282652 RepID=A0A370BG24_9ACTN|nr:ABC transporter family substrate-binding protein [Streptomyces corynorhini]RDG39224.1 ABC transporter family substrate-binding protein [Streptomyces corynorhini]